MLFEDLEADHYLCIKALKILYYTGMSLACVRHGPLRTRYAKQCCDTAHFGEKIPGLLSSLCSPSHIGRLNIHSNQRTSRASEIILDNRSEQRTTPLHASRRINVDGLEERDSNTLFAELWGQHAASRGLYQYVVLLDQTFFYMQSPQSTSDRSEKLQQRAGKPFFYLSTS